MVIRHALISTAFTTLNMALLAPMPSASSRTMSSGTAGRRTLAREAPTTSYQNVERSHASMRTHNAWGTAPSVRTTSARRSRAADGDALPCVARRCQSSASHSSRHADRCSRGTMTDIARTNLRHRRYVRSETGESSDVCLIGRPASEEGSRRDGARGRDRRACDSARCSRREPWNRRR